MKVNFIIEGSGLLKYIGCSTAAKQFVDYLIEKGIEIKINSKEKNFDIIHAHTFGPFALSASITAKSFSFCISNS